MTNIILCGLPGVGKTTVARVLAEVLQRPFIDTDELIEKHVKVSCRHYYREFGEKAFRDVETIVLHQLSASAASVIALGGGVVESTQLVDFISTLGIVILLETSMEQLISRKIMNDNPSFMTNSNDFTLLAERRLPLLKKMADIRINTTDKTAIRIASDILEEIMRFNSGN